MKLSAKIALWMRPILKHLREKWDIDLTISIAILAGVLGLLDRVSPQAISAAILTILALLAVNILRNRWTDDEMQEMIKKLEEHLPKQDGIFITNLEEAENFLKRYIEEHSKQLSDAVVIQYSISIDLLKKLLETNARVSVFIMDENTAKKIGSEQQARYIEDGYDLLSMGLPKPMEQYQIQIFKYQPPCSISGIRIDDELICLSWYTHEYPEDSNRHALGKFQNDSVLVLGHNRAAVVIKKDQEGFEVFKKTFKVLEANYQRHASCIFPAPHVPISTP